MGWELLRYLVFEESLRKSDSILASLGSGWPIFVDLLSNFGGAPTAVIGHSSGEIASAYTTGSISHKYGCKVAYFHGNVIRKLRAMTEIPDAMTSANIPEPEVPVYLAKLYLGFWKDTGCMIKTDRDEDPVPNVDANAPHVVAGRFGGIGRATLQWMANRGAKNLIIPSTSGTSSQAGKHIVIELTRRVTKTVRSKVNTSWNLLKLLPKDINCFIFLSPIAGINGSPEQSNYAAGCTFQDVLARSRSVAINLGWMRTIGIIAETKEPQRSHQNVGDMSQVEADFFVLLEHYCNPLLPLSAPQDSQVLIGVVTQAHVHARDDAPIDALKRPFFASFNAPQLYDVKQHESTVATQEDRVVLFWQAVPPQDRSIVAVSVLKARLARALDASVDDVDSHRNLLDYGYRLVGCYEAA
ncbi:hypothetical protein ACHAPC_008358 [Botrytis cinerea]